jgi:hypothetical protein
MTDNMDNTYVQILDVIRESGHMPAVPDGLEPALKGVSPTWTTHQGFQWAYPGQWTEAPDDFSPITCEAGGLHLATTLAAAQSGGASVHHMLICAYDPADAGACRDGKMKVRRALTLAPIDLLNILRKANLTRADLARADLTGASLAGASLAGADLTGADLARADLTGADLAWASLTRASLAGADLTRADLTGADLAWAKGLPPEATHDK